MAFKSKANFLLSTSPRACFDANEFSKPFWKSYNMPTIGEAVQLIWNYKFSLFPVLSTFVVFEVISILRKYTKFAYTPIYFVCFPVGHTDEMYAKYFNQDYLGVGETQTSEEKSSLRTRIIIISAISMAISAIVNPIITGVYAAFVLTKDQYFEFFWFLFLVKILSIIDSLYRLRLEPFLATPKYIAMVAAIYIIYLIFVLTIFSGTYFWSIDTLGERGVLGLVSGLFHLLVFNAGIQLILAGLVGAVMSYWITNPRNIPRRIGISELSEKE